MFYIDAHCDTAAYILEKNQSLYSNDCAVSIEKGLAVGSWVQFFAAFVHAKECRGREALRAFGILDKTITECEANPSTIKLCLSYADVCDAVKEKKMGAILSLEGGEPLLGSLAMLRSFYRMGVRCIGLTWNYRNELADGVMDSESGGGLTMFGRSVVAEMNRLGMIIDVSHISEKGFWDTVELSSDPIIASHSNAAAVCDHRRNLNDRQLLAIAKNGGVTGINFLGDFLTAGGHASMDDVIRHIEYIVGLTGEDYIGLGSDFDGHDNPPVDVRSILDVAGLMERLLQLNYSEACVRKIAGENMLRVIEQIL